MVARYTFGQAGNELIVQRPTGRTRSVWGSESRHTSVQLPAGGLNTMACRADNLRHRAADSEGSKLMVWDELGYTGYIDLLQERLP